jgi:hypothetical protein
MRFSDMPGNEYKYYRNRQIKKIIFTALLFLLIVIALSVFICNRDGGDAGSKNGDPGMPGKSSADYSEKGPRMDDAGGEEYNGSAERKRLDEKIRASRKRKTVRRKKSSGEDSVNKKVKKIKEEKKRPPKPPTLEIIGEEGKVLMKKE